ncbi:hypothetical protein [Streptomyces sp. NPDC090022]|uniref:hypothetical protein n=1 Tax=Streptomyces sp. NPDC090022 TaxID=3365920 RepID=UPI003814E092
MMKSLLTHLLWGTSVYTALALWLVGPQWAGRSRRPHGRVFRAARRIGWGRSSQDRAAEVVATLAAHVPAGAELPDAGRLRLRLEDRRFSALSVLLVWLFPGLGVVACVFLVLNGEFSEGRPWLMPLLWGMFGAVLVLCEVDRRMLARSLPLEHTTLMAVRAVEACRPPAREDREARGYSYGSAVCAAVDDLCAALGRYAELEPRRTDPVHRARLRAQAQEVVRNLHAAKVRLVDGDRSALGDLYAIVASLLSRTVAPAHEPASAGPLVATAALTADPAWQGPPPRTEATGAKLLGYGLFVGTLIAFGWLLSLLNLPEALSLPLLVVMAGAIHRALKHRLPVPDLPQDLTPAAPSPVPSSPANPGV